MADQEDITDSNTQTTEIPYGFCHCGCGQRTKIATETRKERGRVKGQPLRFIAGHHARTRRTTEEKFWSLVDKSGGPDACWPWMGSKDKGYGRISWLGKTYPAHHLAWILVNGPIPEGLNVCHNCPGGDN